jgi:hypothetical protein
MGNRLLGSRVEATAKRQQRFSPRVVAVEINLDAAVETKRLIERKGSIREVVSGLYPVPDPPTVRVGRRCSTAPCPRRG